MAPAKESATPDVLHFRLRLILTSVDAQNAVVDDGAEAQVVEDVRAVPPHVDAAVLAQTFVVKPVHLGDLPRLVVPADEVYAVRVAHLHVCHRPPVGWFRSVPFGSASREAAQSRGGSRRTTRGARDVGRRNKREVRGNPGWKPPSDAADARQVRRRFHCCPPRSENRQPPFLVVTFARENQGAARAEGYSP